MPDLSERHTQAENPVFMALSACDVAESRFDERTDHQVGFYVQGYSFNSDCS
jgi:hypothetical protein